MLIIRAKIARLEPHRLEEQQKKVHTSSDVQHTQNCHFARIFELVAEKTGLVGRENFFLFFVWSSPIFAGSTILCERGRKDVFFYLVFTDFGGTQANL